MEEKKLQTDWRYFASQVIVILNRRIKLESARKLCEVLLRNITGRNNCHIHDHDCFEPFTELYACMHSVCVCASINN
jgi:hypothetical protein